MGILNNFKSKMKKKITDSMTSAKEIEITDVQFSSRFQSMFKLNVDEVNHITDSMIKIGFDKSHPVHLWYKNGSLLLIDGHTRIAAAKQAGLTSIWAVLHDFKTEDEAYRYALEQQLNRRNLNEAEMLDVLEKYDELNSSKGTNETLAQQLGVSTRQVTKMRTVLHEATPEEREKIKNGETSVNQAYNRIRGVENSTKEKKEIMKCRFCDANGMCMKYKEVAHERIDENS